MTKLKEKLKWRSIFVLSSRAKHFRRFLCKQYVVHFGELVYLTHLHLHTLLNVN